MQQVHGDDWKNPYTGLETLIAPPLANEALAQVKTRLDRCAAPLQDFMREALMLRSTWG